MFKIVKLVNGVRESATATYKISGTCKIIEILIDDIKPGSLRFWDSKLGLVPLAHKRESVVDLPQEVLDNYIKNDMIDLKYYTRIDAYHNNVAMLPYISEKTQVLRLLPYYYFTLHVCCLFVAWHQKHETATNEQCQIKVAEIYSGEKEDNRKSLKRHFKRLRKVSSLQSAKIRSLYALHEEELTKALRTGCCVASVWGKTPKNDQADLHNYNKNEKYAFDTFTYFFLEMLGCNLRRFVSCG